MSHLMFQVKEVPVFMERNLMMKYIQS